MILLEYEQLIYVDRNNELKKCTVQQALLNAQRTRRYAKFYCGRYYITVAFNRDSTVQLSSNYRSDMKFNHDLQRLEDQKYTLYTVTHFIWYWMNKFRKM